MTLAGCSGPAVSMSPAADANNPLCADVSVRLPDALGDQDRRNTDAQATAAWGSPAAVLLSCGVEPPGPSTLPCQRVGGVDWIIDDQGENRYLVTTYGRTPAVQVFLDNTLVSSATVLDSLSGPVSQLPIDATCTEPTTRN